MPAVRAVLNAKDSCNKRLASGRACPAPTTKTVPLELPTGRDGTPPLPLYVILRLLTSCLQIACGDQAGAAAGKILDN